MWATYSSRTRSARRSGVNDIPLYALAASSNGISSTRALTFAARSFANMCEHPSLPFLWASPLSGGGGQRLPWPGFSAISLAGVVQPHKRTGFVRVPGDRCPVRPVADDTHVRTHLDVRDRTIRVAGPVCGVRLPDICVSGAA